MTTLAKSIRISKNEVDNIKNSVYSLNKSAKIYLFGSRADTNKKGGDIDIIILSDIINRKKIRDIRLEFFDKLGEQKLDIVLDLHKPIKAFTKVVLKEAIEL